MAIISLWPIEGTLVRSEALSQNSPCRFGVAKIAVQRHLLSFHRIVTISMLVDSLAEKSSLVGSCVSLSLASTPSGFWNLYSPLLKGEDSSNFEGKKEDVKVNVTFSYG